MAQGFKMAGVGETVIANDIDNRAAELLNHNYNHKVIHADIRGLSWHEFENCNVIAITAPCQYYSNARNINKDSMYHQAQGRSLYLHGFRMIAMVQPEVYIAENVPQYLDYKIPKECFTELRPYDTYVIQADTQDFRLPQVRSRVYFLGIRRKFANGRYTSPDIFQHQIYERQQHIKDIKEDDPEINIPNYMKKRLDGKYRDLPSIKSDKDIANTAVAHYAKDRSTTLVFDNNGYKGLRPFTPREYARLQGIPDTYDLSPVSMTTKYHMIGNSVSPVICRAIALEVKKHFEELNSHE